MIAYRKGEYLMLKLGKLAVCLMLRWRRIWIYWAGRGLELPTLHTWEVDPE